MFSTLGPVAEARVLDLYAGSGAFGLEALSRGAALAVLVECARPAVAVLRDNIAELGLDAEAVVVTTPLPQAVRTLAQLGPFDLVFADPPWDHVDSGEALRAVERLLVEPGTVTADVCLVLEHAFRTPPPVVAGVALGETRRYGDTAVSYYARPAAGRP